MNDEVVRLSLCEEWTWSWPEGMTGTGERGYGYSVATRAEAEANAEPYMTVVRRWVSSWVTAGPDL